MKKTTVTAKDINNRTSDKRNDAPELDVNALAKAGGVLVRDLAVYSAIRAFLLDLQAPFGRPTGAEVSNNTRADDDPFDDLLESHPGDDDWPVDEDEDELPFDDDDDEEEKEESATLRFLREYYVPNDHGRYVLRPRARCADGYSVSIQAGLCKGLRCFPREDTTIFSHVEINTPTTIDEELLPYRLDQNDEEEIFYFFVPVPVVDKVLAKHGGIVAADDDPKGYARLFRLFK